MHVEVLAHIRASSRLADDRRYVAIAQNVMDFTSAKRTKVSDALDARCMSWDAQINCNDIQNASTYGSNAVHLGSGLKRKRSFDCQQTCLTDTALISKRKSHPSQCHDGVSRNDRNARYRDPLRDFNIKSNCQEIELTEGDRENGYARPTRASVSMAATQAEQLETEITGIKHVGHDGEGAVKARYSSTDATQLESRNLNVTRKSFSRTKSLPLVIDALSPTRSQLLAPSYDVPALKATASAFHMPGLFQPRVMTRGIEDKERGYWKVPLTIVASTSVQAVTSLVMRPGTQSDNRAPCSSFEYANLTEAEFEEAWDAISDYIKAGNAGHCVRAIRRQLVIAEGQGFGNDSINLYLQIYCHGEAIPYIYAMLLACTKMRALQCPLEWISALDGKSVITMAEGQIYRGRLGGWKCRKDEQGRSIWLCD